MRPRKRDVALVRSAASENPRYRTAAASLRRPAARRKLRDCRQRGVGQKRRSSTLANSLLTLLLTTEIAECYQRVERWRSVPCGHTRNPTWAFTRTMS